MLHINTESELMLVEHGYAGSVSPSWLNVAYDLIRSY